MSSGRKTRASGRIARQKRVRRSVRGTDAVPRVCVFRSLKFTYAQLISDESNTVLATASTRGLGGEKSAKGIEAAKAVGKKIAELAKEKNVTRAVFDRNGYLYHGRVEAVAAGAREAGLQL